MFRTHPRVKEFVGSCMKKEVIELSRPELFVSNVELGFKFARIILILILILIFIPILILIIILILILILIMILIICLSHASSTGSWSSRSTVEELICVGEQRRAEHRSLPSITTQQIHHADRKNTKYEAWTQIQVQIAKKYCKEKKSSVEPHPSNPTRGRQAGKPA